MSGNKLTTISSLDKNLTRLTYLNLANNYINNLQWNALKGFKALQNLNLANNSINSWADIIKEGSFSHAPNLRYLSLRGNNLTSLGCDRVLISETVSELDVSSANISTVNVNLRDQLPMLNILHMANNNLSQLNQFPPIPLKKLDLSNCSLRQINLDSISDSLLTLNISFNPALQLNFSETHFNYLKTLDLSYCKLDKIDLSNLSSVRELSLRGNSLESSNAISFSSDSSLESLDLSENSLRVIGNNSFSSLKLLTHLNLSNNQIKQLDETMIEPNRYLAYLDLSHNNIQKLTKINSANLLSLNLSWCNITTIESNALSRHGNIWSLDLSQNSFTEIPNDWKSDTLKYLNLSNCMLSTIGNNSLQGFGQLANLHLNGNRFTNPINPSCFRNNRIPEQIELGDNPWTCNCQDPIFLEFRKFVTANQLKVMDKQHLLCNKTGINHEKKFVDVCISIPEEKSNVWSTIMLTILVISFLALFCWYYLKVTRNPRHRNYRRGNWESYNELNCPLDPSN
ncbi:leucine-rich repeats and immunoglobulin-like domains protein sma-10 [Drosophila innubila]|uniref:leucine-rich repeats and immunoglobulin-like domains protein sma-10 n=1 Tax=Drosophila innubila TaxID=198719 RepID=UPI00148B9084|nr:leucine-rich repeats and immunoglobulin-like domains protein sma-10 [Drosophila innubila]